MVKGGGGICDDVPSTAALVIYTYKVVLDTVFYLICTEVTAITWDLTIKWVFFRDTAHCMLIKKV